MHFFLDFSNLSERLNSEFWVKFVSRNPGLLSLKNQKMNTFKCQYFRNFRKNFTKNKGNTKITELRTIFQRESQNSYVYKQTISVNNRKTENRNDPDLAQAFLKKWWVESDFKAPNLPLSLQLKGSGCHYSSIYNNTGTK